MTNPITEPTQSIRERLARAAYPEWFGESGKLLSNYPGQDKSYQKRIFQKVDAILSELMEPSVELRMFMEDALWGDAAADDVHKSWCEIIQHIRDGGK